MTISSRSATRGPFLFLLILAPAAALLLAWALLEDVSGSVRAGLALLLLGALLVISRHDSRGRLWVTYATGSAAVLLALFAAIYLQTAPGNRVAQLLSVTGVACVTAYLIGLQREQGRQMRRVNDLKSNFVALANHELRTPVTILHSTLDTLVEDLAGTISPQHEAFLQAARTSSGALAYLVEMMTQFEALESATEGQRHTIEDLDKLIHVTAIDLREVFASHGVTLTVRLDADAASSKVPQSYARIVLEQLLRNAAKFNRPGGHACLRAYFDEHQLVLEIEDDGRGIPAEERELIFDSFYQNGDVLARTVGGMGLGLSLVRVAVQKMQGSIEVHSLPGEGSTFRVRLPTLVVAGNRTGA